MNPSATCPSRRPNPALVFRAPAPILLARTGNAELAQPLSKVFVASTWGIDEKEIAAARESTRPRELRWSTAGHGPSGDGSNQPAWGHLLSSRGTPSKGTLGPPTAKSTLRRIAPHTIVEIGSDALSPDPIRIACPQPFTFAHGDRLRESVRRGQAMRPGESGTTIAEDVSAMGHSGGLHGLPISNLGIGIWTPGTLNDSAP